MSIRMLYLLVFVAVAGLLGFGVYLQLVQGIEPCPLCNLQRLCFAVVGLSAFFGFLAYGCILAKRLMSTLGLAFSLLGFGLALRQTWIQLNPNPDLSECGVSLQYMLQVLPWHEVARKVLMGSAECSQRTWEFLSLSMAEWSALCFAGLAIVSGFLLKKAFKR